VIALGLSYAPAGDALATTRLADRGNISVYARHRDYHDVVKGMLKHLAQFVVAQGARAGVTPEVKVFVDTAPVMEKPLAEQAGLGWQGKHTNLVSRRHGSWLFLGEIYTSLDLPASDESGGRCGSCRRCLMPARPMPFPRRTAGCATLHLLSDDREPRTDPEPFREAMGNRIYGCDDCLAVCPWNRFATESRHMKLRAREDRRRRAWRTWRGWTTRIPRPVLGLSVKRIGRDRFVRNVWKVGNSGQAALMPVAQDLCEDANAVVAETARWAVGRLSR
jgi:epoxyqueuosine reductase